MVFQDKYADQISTWTLLASLSLYPDPNQERSVKQKFQDCQTILLQGLDKIQSFEINQTNQWWTFGIGWSLWNSCFQNIAKRGWIGFVKWRFESLTQWIINLLSKFSFHTILKVRFLSKISILTKPQPFHEFFTQLWFLVKSKLSTAKKSKSKLNFWTKNEDFEQCSFLTKKNHDFFIRHLHGDWTLSSLSLTSVWEHATIGSHTSWANHICCNSTLSWAKRGTMFHGT